MDQDTFDGYMQGRIDACNKTLNAKREEYTTGGDRLSNFRAAATLEGVPVRVAIGGMLAKHTISIHEMLSPRNAEVVYTQAQWDEKIGDALNYLFLLDAAIKEAAAASQQSTPDPF